MDADQSELLKWLYRMPWLYIGAMGFIAAGLVWVFIQRSGERHRSEWLDFRKPSKNKIDEETRRFISDSWNSFSSGSGKPGQDSRPGRSGIIGFLRRFFE